MHRNEGEWRHEGTLPPLTIVKGGNGSEVPFFNSIIGNSWFIKIDLKQIYCSYSDTQKNQNDFL